MSDDRREFDTSPENNESSAQNQQEGQTAQQSPSERSANANVTSKWQRIVEESRQQERSPSETSAQEAPVESQRQTASSGSEQVDMNSLEYISRDELENQLTALEMQCNEYKSQLARVQAEVANMQRRAQRDVENAYKYSNDKLISALLPVADSLTRALEDVPQQAEALAVQSTYEGIRLTLDLLHKTLSKFGVTVIDPPMGSAFDPEKHEAVSTQPNASVAANSIVQVLQKGYQLNDRILRAAMVIVSSAG